WGRQERAAGQVQVLSLLLLARQARFYFSLVASLIPPALRHCTRNGFDRGHRTPQYLPVQTSGSQSSSVEGLPVPVATRHLPSAPRRLSRWRPPTNAIH